MTTVRNSDITLSVKKTMHHSVLTAERVDPILIKHKDSIKNFAYVTNLLEKKPAEGDWPEVEREIMDRARLFTNSEHSP